MADFSTLKQEILTFAKRQEVCPAYQIALQAETEADLIAAGLDMALWVYESGIVTDAQLSLFDQPTLNANGIYSDGTSYIGGSILPIHCFSAASLYLDLSKEDTATATFHSASTGTVNMSGTSYAQIKCLGNSSLTINLSDNASLSLEIGGSALVTVNAYGDTAAHLVANGSATVVVTGGGMAYAKGRFYGSSQLTYTPSEGMEGEFQFFNNAFLTNPV